MPVMTYKYLTEHFAILLT